jgi:hypothetical protein
MVPCPRPIQKVPRIICFPMLAGSLDGWVVCSMAAF